MLSILAGIIFYCLSISIAQCEEKIFTYKEINGTAKEIEIHFPKNHDKTILRTIRSTGGQLKVKHMPLSIMSHGKPLQ